MNSDRDVHANCHARNWLVPYCCYIWPTANQIGLVHLTSINTLMAPFSSTRAVNKSARIVICLLSLSFYHTPSTAVIFLIYVKPNSPARSR